MASLSASHLAPAGGGFEPQRPYNWFLTLDNSIPGAGDIKLAVEDAFLPVEENTILTLPYGNEEIYVAGKAKFSGGSIKVRDFIDKDIYGALRQWRAQVYDVESGNIFFAGSYKKTARLALVSPDMSVSREYAIEGLWPSKISPAALSYASATAVLEITMTLSFDRAKNG